MLLFIMKMRKRRGAVKTGTVAEIQDSGDRVRVMLMGMLRSGHIGLLFCW